mmetsp:Transcript_14089/g.42138  ORF Transcript_14089/g.42138 Transcript_14089/m.42138 type:complete len:219 (-) Transcript_14089:175-831(-)
MGCLRGEEVLEDRHRRLREVRSLRRHHLVDEAVLASLLRGEEEIAVAVRLDLGGGLAREGSHVAVKDLADVEDLLRLDLHIGGLALSATKRLVDHDARVGERAALALRAGTEEEGTHGGGHAEADRGHVARHVLHGVEDGHASRHGAARGVDVQSDVLVRVLGSKVQKLSHEHVRDIIVHLLAQEEHTVLQEATRIGKGKRGGGGGGGGGRRVVRVLK